MKKDYPETEELFTKDNETERGAPPLQTKTDGKKTSVFWKRFSSVALAVGMFFAGYLASDLQYDGELKTLKRIKEQIQTHYFEEITDDQFYGVIFDAVNNDLLDLYSGYMTPDEYQALLKEATGEWSGLGIGFRVEDEEGNKQLLIQRVSGNSPAESVGVKEGDCVIGYGMDESSMILSEDYESFVAFLKDRAKDENFLLKLRRGSEEIILEICKKTFIENYVFYRSSTSAYAFTGENGTDLTERGEPLTALDSKTAYIRLTQFNGNAATEFRLAMGKFKEEGKTNLVLDLRSNGGGYMSILQEIASYFCKGASGSSLIAVAKYRGGQRENFYADNPCYEQYFTENSKIKVLADSMTASASECLIGAMVDYGAITYEDICLSERGGIAKTYGKGIMQTTRPFSLIGNSGAMKLTTAKIYWPKSGNCIHGRGVLPEDGAKTVQESYEKDVEISLAIAKLFE